MSEAYFDRIETVGRLAAYATDVVTHRNAAGDVFAFHSPLDRGPLHCEICETPGVRVAFATAPER